MKVINKMMLSVITSMILTVPLANVWAADVLEEFQRKTPSGQYIDPASFFRFHGYVSVSFAQAERDLGGEANRSPQILISGKSARTGKNESGFKHDAALFVGGEPFDGVGSVLELHFVGNALQPVITEAKLTWEILREENSPVSLRVSGGRFWWPFGIHNDEWFSAVNHFNVVSPAASEVVPAHYNEVGIMAEGELKLSDHLGMNYVGSVGNGVPSFELMDNVNNTAIDSDGNRTATGRLSLVYHNGARIDFGVSGAGGGLRDQPDAVNFLASDARRYAGGFHAYGPDFSIAWKNLGLRSYYYRSREFLIDAPRSEIDRQGITAEPSYTIKTDMKYLKHVMFHGRFSSADEDTIAGTTSRWLQYGGGINLRITKTLNAKLGYIVQEEAKSAVRVDNDVFSASLTAEF